MSSSQETVDECLIPTTLEAIFDGSSSIPNITQEQMEIFREIIDTCLNRSEEICKKGQRILAQDPRVNGVMFLLAPFIEKTIFLNVAGENFKMLIMMIQMLRALMKNRTLNLENTIGFLILGPMNCLMNEKICTNPGAVDHWAVRICSSSILSTIAKRYSFTKPSIIDSFKEALMSESLEIIYGGIIGLGGMGEAAIREWLLPKLKDIAERILPYLNEEEEMTSVSLKTLAANYILEEVFKICGPLMPIDG
ncbi:transcription initiation factor TFIID subunit 6-like [Drosophila serrata]|uniref:transcription initiation factor TFIID subunit 6-like n=1 Tax=Drosophila serrata TaxID=7274 RepID=UPI000A1D03B1|nr:transcription initiation factor TFIID subunit 6-like [Drosophila serrata]